MVALGIQPQTVDVLLPAGEDFVATIRNPDGDWPAGIGVVLELTGPSGFTEWHAQVSGDEIAWDVDNADVAAARAAGARTARLVYVEADGTRLPWAKGRVRSV